MAFNENSIAFIKAKNMLDSFVDQGGDVNELKNGDREYDYIKNIKAKDENGNRINLEMCFQLLNHPRKMKYVKNAKEALIQDVREYRLNGGSFHIERKKLPFYERLNTYAKSLKKTSSNITHEQAMKDLGFYEYSDIYYRCIGLGKLKDYRDDNGYVDDYRTNAKLKSYIQDLSKTYGLPYYLIITLLCDENLKKCSIFTEYVELVKQQLANHKEKFGTLKGLKSKDNSLYERFNTLIKYYSDGTEDSFIKEEWLIAFELDEDEHKFRDNKKSIVDIESIMQELKETYGNTLKLKDLDRKLYRKIIRKAVAMGVSVSELFNMYGIQVNGIKINRLSKVYVTEIPYLNEMKAKRDKLIEKQINLTGRELCKEEIFEIKLKVCKQVYEEYKAQIYNFVPDNQTGEELNN